MKVLLDRVLAVLRGESDISELGLPSIPGMPGGAPEGEEGAEEGGEEEPTGDTGTGSAGPAIPQGLPGSQEKMLSELQLLAAQKQQYQQHPPLVTGDIPLVGNIYGPAIPGAPGQPIAGGPGATGEPAGLEEGTEEEMEAAGESAGVGPLTAGKAHQLHLKQLEEL